MDNAENVDKWQQLERWRTRLYQIGGSGETAATEADLLEVWCAHLYQAAQQLSPYVHSFYVCLYEPEVDETAPLHFVWGIDEGYRSESSRKPLGSGPTSLVVRTGQPYVLTPQTRLYQASGNRFGQTGRPSLSAIHLPLRYWSAAASERDASILRGVVSVQSYRSGLWTRRDTQFVLDLQCRADDAARHWFNTVKKAP